MAAIVRARNELVRVAFALDPPQTIGRPRRMSTLETIQLIVYMCRAGCPWSMLPCPHAVSYKTVYHRFNLWSRMRIFERAFYNLSIQYRQHSHHPLIVDSTQVKNVFGVDVRGRNHADRGRNSTKVSLLTDSRAVPIAISFFRGNRNDCQTLHHTLNEACRKTGGTLSTHGNLHADKGYDSATCRSICTHHGLNALIPQRRTPPIRDSIRIMVEIAIGRFDKFRRIIMRYDARIANMKSFHYIAGAHMFPAV